jgi:hypothetical protein
VSLRSAIVAGGVFTILMLLLLAGFGAAFGAVEVLLWLVALIVGWLWILQRARPKGTR